MKKKKEKVGRNKTGAPLALPSRVLCKLPRSYLLTLQRASHNHAMRIVGSIGEVAYDLALVIGQLMLINNPHGAFGTVLNGIISFACYLASIALSRA
jgi:hypothetical protein